MPTIGAIISSTRKRKGLNQTTVAKEIGMKLSTYAKKESDGGFTDEQLKQLSKFLQIKYTELQKAKVNGRIVIDDAINTMLEKTMINESYLSALSDFLVLFVASQRGESVDVVQKEFDKILGAILPQQVKKGG